MNACCANCVSPSADAATVCTECLTVSAAGASLSIPTLVASVAAVVGLAIMVRVVRRMAAVRTRRVASLA